MGISIKNKKIKEWKINKLAAKKHTEELKDY